MDKHSFGLSKAVSYIIMLVMIIFFLKVISTFVERSSQGDTTAIENSINSALMQCYALEGAYPAEKEYLKEYGVWFNEDKYYYDYDYFDGGIMPMISVVSKSDRKALEIEGQEEQDIFIN